MKSLRPYQQEIVAKTVAELETRPRATVQMACGTGKTLIGLWVAERLQVKNAVIFAPTLGLLAQLAREWLANSTWPDVACLAVCSDNKLTVGFDEIRPEPEDCPFQVTGDDEAIRHYFEQPFAGVKLIFCTYQSSPLLGMALGPKRRLDLGIFDEAHRATGPKDALFTFALENRRMAIRKRLFMTATPRNFFSDESSWRARVYSMDREKDYGRLCAGLSFAEAVAQGIILPYRTIVSLVNSLEILPEELDNGVVRTEAGNIDARSAAIRQSFILALEQYGIKKIITFHSTIEAARQFTQTHLRDSLPGYEKLHISSKMPANERRQVLARFGAVRKAVLSNARCLTEGIDVPDVDMVAFMDPKSSEVDVIQAMGRATRRAAGKKSGYVFVPLFVDSNTGEDPGEAAERSAYTPVWQVLRALAAIDSRLSRDLEVSCQNLGYGRETDWPESAPLDFVGDSTVDLARIRRGVTIMMLRRISDSWDEHYGELLRFYESHGHSRMPSDSSLYPWLQAQRRKWNTQLSQRQRELLLAVDFDPDPRTSAWQRGLAAFQQYIKEGGDPNRMPMANPLHGWLRNLRDSYRKGILPADKMQSLEKLGVDWHRPARDEIWQGHFEQLKAYKEAHGHPNITAKEDKKLYTWLKAQVTLRREGRLQASRLAALEALGLEWEPRSLNWLERYFEDTLQRLAQHRAEHGSCVIPSKPAYGFLQQRAVRLRKEYQAGHLSAVQIARCEALGFDFAPMATVWQRNFERLQAYVAEGGDPNRMPMANPLHGWLRNLRDSYRKGILPADKMQSLEKLGVDWHRPARDEIWQGHFEQLKAYKEAHGHPNITAKEDKKLYDWLKEQRLCRREGRLQASRLAALEALGLEWEPRSLSWLERNFEDTLQRLAQHRAEHGSCAIPNKPEFRFLQQRALRLRKEYQAGHLSAVQIARCEALGFDFAPMATVWQRNFERLQAYVKGGGDPNRIPTAHPLRSWLRSLRDSYRKGALPLEKRRLLAQLGVDWHKTAPPSPEDIWQERFEQLKAYKKAYGHLNVSKKQDEKLYKWLKEQRLCRREGRLQAGRLAALDALGLDWEPGNKGWLERYFEDTLQRLAQHRAEHGS